MKLNLKSIKETAWWRERGYQLPEYDIEKVRANTLARPEWVHFGAGNIFRAFLGAVDQRLLNQGLVDTGISVFEGFDTEIIEKAYRPFDNLSVGVTLIGTGSVKKEVIASVAESLTIADDARMEEIFTSASLKMASFTITEKGYSVAFAKADAQGRPEDAKGLMGYLTQLLLKRYRSGALPVALVSMDNCSHNGEKLQNAVMYVAGSWLENGYVDEGFIGYLKEKVSFPWSMIDKITPRPDSNVMSLLEKDGFEDAGLIVTSRNTYTSAFVNAEEKEYLVIEDAFPNGRVPLDKAGIYFTDRETVEKVERMKVTTCLNPLHTCLAVFGCLLDYDTIWKEMNDSDLKKLVYRIGYQEGLPVVTDPGIMKPETFLEEVLTARLPNCFLPDTPQRIATDTSQKLSIRFGETIKEYIKRGMDLSSLKGIVLVEAGWLRYLMGVNDAGKEMAVSPDPRLEEMKTRLDGVRFGDNSKADDILPGILSDESIFGVDLMKIGLGKSVIHMFKQMNDGAGQVRRAISEIE
ncbi:MAG: mannitol dehydrogenase family protein [Clostridiales bacterium]|nr:mannitol dehydrogenase family protein [Clostridiales bacterium]